MSRRKRTLYLTLITLGGLALAVDRLLLNHPITGPEDALGGLGTELLGAAPPPIRADSREPIPELVFPRPLPDGEEKTAIRDVFSPPPGIFAKPARNQSTDQNAHADGSADSPTRLSSAELTVHHRLTGVLIDGTRSIAILDGGWLRIGEEVDGCRLVALTGQEAEFQCHDGKAVLLISGRSGTPSP